MISNRIKSTWAMATMVALLADVAAGADFDQVVKLYLKENCIRCHGPEKQKGKLTLHTVTDRFGTDAEVEGWVDVLDMLSF